MKKSLIFVFLLTILLFPASQEEVKRSIENIMSSLPAGSTAGILIYNPLTQDTIYQMNAELSMIPASNAKIFTTAVAISLLGGDYQVSTKLHTADKNIKDGVINGNLYIKGYGYSLFTESDLMLMVNDLKSKGIKKITGNIIGDDSYFDDVYYRTDWIPDEVTNVKLPPVSALVIDRNRIVTYKKIRRRLRTVTSDIKNPPLYIATLLKQKLKSAGIESGQSTVGITPQNVLTLNEAKISLRELISIVNKQSDNFLAECLFKTIGAEVSRKQGNSFFSTQAILNFLEENSIDRKGTAIVDGSGISRFDQATPIAVVGVLEKMYFDIANFEDFYNSLSIAGVDGTLRNRLIGTPAENNVHGKTGTLNGVSSLCGYITTQSGEDLIVSMIFEFSGGARIHKDIQDDILKLLADWKRT